MTDLDGAAGSDARHFLSGTARVEVRYRNLWSRFIVGTAFERQFVVPLESPPALLRTSLEWYERHVLRVDAHRIPIDRPIFLVGLPRSGTTMLQDILCAHPRAAYITNTMHQFRTCFCAAEDLRKRFRVDAHGERFVRDGVQVALGSANEGHAFLADWRHVDPHSTDFVPFQRGQLSQREVEQVRNAVRKMIWCFDPSRRRRFFNKNPTLIPYLDLVVELFPDARVIHLVRDARTVANSLLKLYRRHREQEARVRAALGKRAAAREWFVPYPRLPRLREYLEAYGPDDIRTTAHVWDDAITCVRSAKSRLPALYEVRYEDIVARPRDELLRLLDFCELEAPPPECGAFWRGVDAIHAVSPSTEYTDFDVIETICAANMRAYQYL